MAKIAEAARTQAAAAARERWARAATEVLDGGGGGRRREKLRVKRTWQGRDLRSSAQRRSDAEDGLLNLLKPKELAEPTELTEAELCEQSPEYRAWRDSECDWLRPFKRD